MLLKDYYVTSCGRVWSFKTNKFLTPHKDRKGYLIVHIGNKFKRIHRLVAETYIPNPDNLETVDHIDGNKENNCVNNLQWMTRGDNKSKSWSKPVYCVELDKTFPNGAAAAKELGLNPGHISSVCNGKRKTHGGYHFKFV